MVKVREFCCGCSLRSGTFTIAWSLLIYITFCFIDHTYNFFYLRRIYLPAESRFPSLYIFAYDVLRSIAGIAVSLTALYALHKNKIILLNGIYWYLCYMVVSFLLSVILLISNSDWEHKLVETNSYLRYMNFGYLEYTVIFIIIYIAIAGIITYFTLIVKSYRDYSMRNEAQNVQFVGPDATTVGYIAA